MTIAVDAREGDARQRQQRSRNRALALVIAGLCVLFYLITIAKMTG
jgi:hypothetical protein